jgi:hypothetical protein
MAAVIVDSAPLQPRDNKKRIVLMKCNVLILGMRRIISKDKNSKMQSYKKY